MREAIRRSSNIAIRVLVFSLEEEQRSLLGGLLYIDDAAPQFLEYLKRFPSLEMRDVENSISWAKIDFGLKPVVIVTHVATYASEDNGTRRILVVSKQLYAIVALVREANFKGQGSESWQKPTGLRFDFRLSGDCEASLS
ncbi:MAG: hypothetical protein ACMG6H_17325 [Acidobacteriota bacterium]